MTVNSMQDPVSAHSGQGKGDDFSTAELLLEVSNRLAVIDTLEGQLEELVELTTQATGATRGGMGWDGVGWVRFGWGGMGSDGIG